jgi:hypothetical protein
MACAIIPPGLMMSKPQEQPERQLALFDKASGEVLGEVVKMRARGGAPVRNARLMRALQRFCQAHSIHLDMWTFGTNHTTPDRLSEWAVVLGDMWTRQSRMWTLVLEAGTEGGRWHIHALVAGEQMSWQGMKDFWQGLTMIKGAHVERTATYSDGVGGYLSKYLAKAHQGGLGYRRFRSSRHLRRTVAAFIDPPGQPVCFLPKGGQVESPSRNLYQDRMHDILRTTEPQ